MKLTSSTLCTIVSLLFVSFSFHSLAQSKYFTGYIVMLNGDTLKGEIRKNPKREFDNFSKAGFRKPDGTDTKTYRPEKIKEYFVEGYTYISRNVDGEQVFVKRLSQGAVNLYELQIEVLQMNDVKVKSDYYMEKRDGEFVRIKSGKFKKQIVDVMGDNEDIVKGLEEKKYEYDNIVEVFNAYNSKPLTAN